MGKMIRHVSELPEWFDIHPYEQWEDKEPCEAAWAVSDRLFMAGTIYAATKGPIAHPLADETIEQMLDKLPEIASDPYRRTRKKVMYDLILSETKAVSGEEVADRERQTLEETWELEATTLEEAKRILGAPIARGQESVSRVSLWCVLNWMKENADILDEIESTAKRLSEKHGWDIDEVRESLQDDIPVWGPDGEDFIRISGEPTIPAVLKKIEKHLTARSIPMNGAASVRYSDVRKLFDYRVAAYVDLDAWSLLTGNTITKKCMANALFPDGRYGELDMMPSKTVGRFIKRLQNGYIHDVVAKASEMENMQS